MWMMRWSRPVSILIGMVIVCLAVSDAGFVQCPMCKAALVNSAEGQRLASGFNRGILFLLSAPFLAVGTIVFLIFRAQRRVSTATSLLQLFAIWFAKRVSLASSLRKVPRTADSTRLLL